MSDSPKSNEGGVSRRQLFVSGAAGALGLAAATAGPAAAEDGSPSGEQETAEIAVVAAVLADGKLRLRTQNGAELEMADPAPREVWESGQEVVVVRRFNDGRWEVADLQRLYRPIEEQEVREAGTETIETTGGELELTPESEPRGGEGYTADGYTEVPLDEIEEGDYVRGLGHRPASGEGLVVDLLGVKRS